MKTLNEVEKALNLAAESNETIGAGECAMLARMLRAGMEEMSNVCKRAMEYAPNEIEAGVLRAAIAKATA